ncbi:ATP-grasp domain-containing protein [Streptomyces longwoodensis]|uniref:ATP-grasp domain-containing protein n=1 Tax=Streptomyces novoguineensis TaxID=2586640 RepID=A0A4Y5QS62_9ACTN|nr:Amc18 [Streptomyces novoguineensis]QHW08545.1 ATP-grasp domain-containing protein [Streptomyces novoguineensis]BBE52695.1 ATP-grasp ligase [Streptomyces sp.]
MKLPPSQAPATSSTLLLVGSGTHLRQGHLLSQLAAAADVVLLDTAAPTWQKPWIRDAEVYDRRETPLPVEQARRLCRDHDVRAVVSYSESEIVLAAELAEALGLPGLPVEAARLCRDKHRQRELLNRTGLSPTASVLVHDVQEGLRAAADIGYPVVVKPRGLSGSLGVGRVSGPADFTRFFGLASGVDTMGLASDGFLVEECVTGTEFLVDVWSSGGTAEVVYSGRKYMANDPYPIDTGHIMGEGALPDAEYAAGLALARDAVLAAGIDRTIANLDVVLTPDGPRVMEINGRPAGDLAPVIADLGTGLSVGGLLADAALGRPLHAEPVPNRAAGIKFLYPARRQRFEGLAEAPELRVQPWLHEVGELPERGSVVEPPPDDYFGRAGWVIATGSHADQVHERLTEAERALTVQGPSV